MEMCWHSSCLTTAWHQTHLGMAQGVTTWLVWSSDSAPTQVPTWTRTPRNASRRSKCLRRTATTAKNPKQNRATISGHYTLLTLFRWSWIRHWFSHNSTTPFLWMTPYENVLVWNNLKMQENWTVHQPFVHIFCKEFV